MKLYTYYRSQASFRVRTVQRGVDALYRYIVNRYCWSSQPWWEAHGSTGRSR
jgi:hypothetical protein